MKPAIVLPALSLLLSGCVVEPYRPVGYTLPSATYYQQPSYDPYARQPAPPPPPLMTPLPEPEPSAPQDPDANYETPPVLLQPMEPAQADQDAPPPVRPDNGQAAAPPPPPEPPTSQAVPLMGFRPMRGQTTP